MSTLIKWFPDRRGMATGMAIMGFWRRRNDRLAAGDGADGVFSKPTRTRCSETFVALAMIYLVFMLIGTFGYRVPPAGCEARLVDSTGQFERDDIVEARTFP